MSYELTFWQALDRAGGDYGRNNRISDVRVTFFKNIGSYPRLLVGCVEVVRGVEVASGL